MDRADRLFAIDEIRNLKARYFRLMDGKDWAALAEVFAEDARFDARCSLVASLDDTSDAAKLCAGDDYTGRDTIIAFIRRGLEGNISVHHGHGHEVTILSEDRAEGVIAMEDYIFLAGSGALMLHGYGHYHETYRHVGGAWRIQTSRISRLFVQFTPPAAA